jgi:cytosine/adenosine deaminase-related metal-dependent hydrolase
MAEPVMYRSRWMLEPDFSVIENAALVAADGVIQAAGRFSQLERTYSGHVVDFGDAWMLPGFINAHTHLELSGLKGKIAPTPHFIEWLGQLIPRRLLMGEQHVRDATELGITESLEAGTTCIVDISSFEASIAPLQHAPVRKWIFFEAIDLNPQTARQTAEQCRTRLSQTSPHPLLSPGISPHAPYSVSPELFKTLHVLARENKLLMAVHCAEVKEELEFLMNGRGKMYERFSLFRFIPKGWTPPSLPSVRYLNSLGLLDSSMLLIHCNYPSPDEVDLVKHTEASVVYCPGSHRFFSHDPYPLREYLRAGITVCVGTDSLASNESLSLLRELRILHEQFPELRAAHLVQLCTWNAAKALRSEDRLGLLREGYQCDVTALEPSSSARQTGSSDTSHQLEALLLDPSTRCCATVVAGEVAYRAPQHRVEPSKKSEI